MKKLYFITILLCGFVANAQTPINLNFSDLGVPVRSYDIRIDSALNSAIQPGMPGTNQTWNFITLHSTLDTLQLGLIYNYYGAWFNSFPLANVAYHAGNKLNYNYYNSSAIGLLHYGIVSDYLNNGDTIKVAFTQADTIVKLPGVYGDSTISIAFGDSKSKTTYHIDTTILIGGNPISVPLPVDSIRIKHWQIHSAKFDAWGTMNTPTNMYPALRQKNRIATLDTIWAYFNCSGFPAPYDTNTGWYMINVLFDTTLNYTWWMKDLGIPALKMFMHSPSGSTVDKVEWVYDVTIGIPENSINNSGLFPNPANNFINITNTSQYNEVIVYNMLGNEVIRQNIQNNNEISVSTADISDGMYFYNLIGRSGKTTGKFVVIH